MKQQSTKQQTMEQQSIEQNAMEQQSIELIIQTETEKRLREMQNTGYAFPKACNGSDWFAIIAGIAVSLILVLLCMMEVIV